MRASLMFQLSKLCSLLLKAARLATGGAEWDALVAGAIPLLPSKSGGLWHRQIILRYTLRQC